MQSKRKVLATIGLVGFGLICVLWAAAIIWGQTTKDIFVPQHQHWEQTPVICPNHDVDLVQLNKAVEWWQKQGHSIEIRCEQPWTVSVHIDPSIDERSSIEDVDYDQGRAWKHAHGDVLVNGEITLLPEADALVMAHEIGHILGYSHHWLIPSGHIMHPKRRGWDGRGVQRVQR